LLVFRSGKFSVSKKLYLSGKNSARFAATKARPRNVSNKTRKTEVYMRNYISILIILFSSIIANAQSNPDEMIKKFFLEFAVNSDKAINDIYATNPNIGGITDAINNMKKIAKSYPEQLGKNYGYELISQQKCTDNFILHAYLVKY
jgi:hypothetical protein